MQSDLLAAMSELKTAQEIRQFRLFFTGGPLIESQPEGGNAREVTL